MVAERLTERVARTETTDELVRYDILVAPHEGFRVRDSEAGGFDHQIRLLNILPIQLEVVDSNNPDNRQNTIVEETKVYGRSDTYRLYPQPAVDGQRLFFIVARKGVEVEPVDGVDVD